MPRILYQTRVPADFLHGTRILADPLTGFWVDRSAIGTYPSTARQKPRSIASGFAAIASLYLLDSCTICGRTVRPRDRRHGPRELDVSQLELPEVATQPNGEETPPALLVHARPLVAWSRP